MEQVKPRKQMTITGLIKLAMVEMFMGGLCLGILIGLYGMRWLMQAP